MAAEITVVNTNSLARFRRIKKQQKKLEKTKLTRNEFLKDQILNHDRIDLLMTEVLGYTIKDFHYLMWYHRKNCHKKIDRQEWHLALAPRGGGKSTILTVASILIDILRDPNIRILIASKTDENAVGFLTEIKQHLESKKLIEIFGPQKGDVWNTGEINVVGRTKAGKENTITTRGKGSALASKHFDKIYGDDLVDEENSKTPTQRRTTWTWFFKVVVPTLFPSGKMSIVGTRYHPEDLYGALIDSVFTKKDKKGKIIKNYYIRVPALLKKKKFLARTKASKKYVSFWPEEFSVKFLLASRKNSGTIIFNSQMQNDVDAMKGKIFKVDWFQWYKMEDINMKELKIFQGVDLAIKQKEDADKFAHVTIGIHPKSLNIYVLDYFNQVTHYTYQKKVIKSKFDKYDPVKVAIEANGYQRALIQDMRLDSKLSSIRAIPVFTEIDKTIRAWKLSAYFERGQILLLEGMHELQEQLMKMPDGRYKDLFDALDIAVTSAFGGNKKVREHEPGLI